MQELKPYLIPGLALAILLLWFFVIQPRMGGDETTSPEPQTATETNR